MHICIGLLIGGILFFIYDDLIMQVKISVLIIINDISQAFTHTVIHHRLENKYDWIKDTKKRIINAVILHTIGTFIIFFTVIGSALDI